MALNRFQQEILIEALDDWVGLWEIAKLIREGEDELGGGDVREPAIQLLATLLKAGYILAGDLTPEGKFSPWRIPYGRATARIDDEWRHLGRDPEIGEICWFEATDVGHSIANDILNTRGVER